MYMQSHSQNIHTHHNKIVITHTDTHRHKATHTQTHTHSQPHSVQWLYFKFEKEVELNESYPAVRFPGTGLTSSAASPPPPHPPSLWASLVTPSAPSPCPHSWLCHPALTDLPTVNSHTLYACLSVSLSPETYNDNTQQKIHHLMVSVGQY